MKSVDGLGLIVVCGVDFFFKGKTLSVNSLSVVAERQVTFTVEARETLHDLSLVWSISHTHSGKSMTAEQRLSTAKRLWFSIVPKYGFP